MKLTREQVEECKKTLYVYRGEAVGAAWLALLQHELERVKDLLVDPSTKNVEALQGEAQAYLRQLKYLKEPPADKKKV